MDHELGDDKDDQDEHFRSQVQKRLLQHRASRDTQYSGIVMVTG